MGTEQKILQQANLLVSPKNSIPNWIGFTMFIRGQERHFPVFYTNRSRDKEKGITSYFKHWN